MEPAQNVLWTGALRLNENRQLAKSPPASRARLTIHTGFQSISPSLPRFVSFFTRMSQNMTRPSDPVVTKKLHSFGSPSCFTICPDLFTCTPSRSQTRSVTFVWWDFSSDDRNLGLITGTVESSPSPLLTLWIRLCWWVVSHRQICPLYSPPAMTSGRSGLNRNEKTSNGDSRTYWGWIGSLKFQISTAEVRACPAISSRWLNEMGSEHETATTPSFPGIQSIEETTLPLEYTRSVKLWNSVMEFSPLLAVKASSSVRIEKWSSEMSVISFCCRAVSQVSKAALMNSFIPSLPSASAFSASPMVRGAYCVDPFCFRPEVACTPVSTITGMACTALFCSRRFSSKLGSLNGRHSICEEFHISWASLSMNLIGWLNSTLLRTIVTTMRSRDRPTVSSAISASLPRLTHGFDSGLGFFFFFFFFFLAPGFFAFFSSSSFFFSQTL